MNKPRGLGRGLDVLLPSSRVAPPPAPSSGGSTGSGSDAFLCALEKIVPNRGQPRKDFDDAALNELAASIKEHGLIEPLVVRRLRDDRFELIAGERRWRASQRAGLRDVFVIVKDVDDKKAYELALIENVQREDLNAIEFAGALRKLIDEYGHTQETLAVAVGKDRTTITNALRLLKLPARICELIVQGALTEGHGRALLGLSDERAMLTLAELAARKKFSVRQVEAEVRRLRDGKTTAKPAKSVSVRDLETRLARKLGTRCEVKDRDGKGELVIRYATLDELDRILEVLL